MRHPLLHFKTSQCRPVFLFVCFFSPLYFLSFLKKKEMNRLIIRLELRSAGLHASPQEKKTVMICERLMAN